MSNQMLMYMMIGIGVLFAIIVLAYILISKKLNSSETREIQKLRQGTQAKKFTAEVLYQKLYVIYRKIPFIKRYLLKIRRKPKNKKIYRKKLLKNSKKCDTITMRHRMVLLIKEVFCDGL